MVEEDWRLDRAKGEAPLFPFEYGLSYTKFDYGELSAAPAGSSATIKLHLDNAGGRDGDETVQCYLEARNRPASRRAC